MKFYIPEQKETFREYNKAASIHFNYGAMSAIP